MNLVRGVAILLVLTLPELAFGDALDDVIRARAEVVAQRLAQTASVEALPMPPLPNSALYLPAAGTNAGLIEKENTANHGVFTDPANTAVLDNGTAAALATGTTGTGTSQGSNVIDALAGIPQNTTSTVYDPTTGLTTTTTTSLSGNTTTTTTTNATTGATFSGTTAASVQ
jgi:hypothetical protein